MTKKIGAFIARGLQPFSVVEEPSFIDMIRCAIPEYVVPSRKTFSRTVVPNLYEAKKKELKERVRNVFDNGGADVGQRNRAPALINVTMHDADEWSATETNRDGLARLGGCTGLSISLEPEQIRELAREINQTIASLTDIDAILRETGPDLALAKELKARADLARDKANKILDTAKKVLQNLNDAEQAQDRAKQAIEKARDNIEAAEKDLDQIEDATASAQGVANRSLDQVGHLQDRLAELKKKYSQNNLDARKAVNEAKAADRQAEQAQQASEAEELEEQYKRAMADLSGKSAASGDMKDRAEKLRERARKLAEGVNSKTTMLQGEALSKFCAIWRH
ncbi:hypothetical protein HPB47_019655 [Ixodes persulcatus]|uniref:Uncharacterized protein n=1 Tax=Ixodes persulcatus TaxID=34615 RepID=A0AC60QHI6_IXOPE|nr:hypothetical protein HPB47_019655 [Ixodes persulcatus]